MKFVGRIQVFKQNADGPHIEVDTVMEVTDLLDDGTVEIKGSLIKEDIYIKFPLSDFIKSLADQFGNESK